VGKPHNSLAAGKLTMTYDSQRLNTHPKVASNPTTAITQSKIGVGWVRHRRYLPKAHSFQYPLHLFCLNLDHIESDFKQHPCYSTRPNLVWFRRKDYFYHNQNDPNQNQSSQSDLKQALLDHIEQLTGHRLSGPILIATHLRCLGFNFNPVTFYFCYDQQPFNQIATNQPAIILAQITNTPWGERHTYTLSCKEALQHPGVIKGQQRGNIQVFEFSKAFLVSPFMPMDMHYRWSFKLTSSALIVHMINQKAGQKTFDATLKLQWLSLTHNNLTSALYQHPLMPLKVVGGIYWQAFNLLLKRIPFYGHP
jgi:DUF1365 family protein